MNAKMSWLTGALLTLIAAQATAQEKGCILLKTVAEIEQVTTDERGEQSTRLVPAEKIVPGNEVIYTVSATNVCDQEAQNVVIDNPVPQHMDYIGGSAIGPGTEVTFSIDGGANFGKADALKVAGADGKPRQAEPREYTNIRWVMRNPLKPGAVAFARFRAILE
jgi:uncharacterized repeat protein (TIGR01451 family)